MSHRVDFRQGTSRVSFRAGTFTATISSDDSCRVVETRGHETWSGAARRILAIADKKGIVLENRALIEARIAEGK